MRILLNATIGLAACSLLSACASHPEPIVDMQGVDPVRFERDRDECAAYAAEVKPATGAAKGAVAGAAVGAATGAISGDASRGAGYGGIYGASRSGLRGNAEKQAVFKRCLRGRGYRVLN
ncbi:MAG: glycine zipper family protein [Woeseia sp.]|nr:hypothetical protein [Woeseia sp.]MBT8095626.1 hypothetical protein [Woeseia sp.]NNE61538.1 glycine zipper family protein [Woeseia sp.]NNL54134.1 glycine zipper family protein [Woeseia sp.]